MAPHSTAEVTDSCTMNGSGSVHKSAVLDLCEAGSSGDGAYKRPNMQSANLDCVHDVICVGFGPASLSIAIAVHDAMERRSLPQGTKPKLLFIEKQGHFAWHAGMLLPGAKMQISFIKDMASLRDPRSHFTFMNYLHHAGRLVEFINLNTFLPSRAEYDDYLRWCADQFADLVRYGEEVLSVSPTTFAASKDGVHSFTVTSIDCRGNTHRYKAKNVIMALGGQASIPKCLPQNHPRIVHSSAYVQRVPKILSDTKAPYRVAVIGAGQSAAEIFYNIQTLYPNSRTSLVMRQEWLKPSDDSPFVNSIFNPCFTDVIFDRHRQDRASVISDARATNYGVVRLGLIEHLFERMYDQKRELGPDEKTWPHRILARRSIVGLEESGNVKERPKLRMRPIEMTGTSHDELLEVDLVIVATGYRRDRHVEMLKDVWDLLPAHVSDEGARNDGDGWEVQCNDGTKRIMEVGRDYKVKFSEGRIAPGSGVFLQGCCEATHGLSDTLLSVLAVRSGEIVDSIFKPR